MENSQASLYHNTEDFIDYYNQKSLSKSFATFNHAMTTDCLRKQCTSWSLSIHDNQEKSCYVKINKNSGISLK